MFESVEQAPPDPILGLTEAFQSDPSAAKINLSVGVYKDSSGRTPVLGCVKSAEERILAAQTTKSYKPITGDPAYGRRVRDLLFGPEHPVQAEERAVTAHAPGGTGALRVAGDFLRAQFPEATVWVSQPTWANHPGVFSAAGVRVDRYPWFDADRNALDIDRLLGFLREVKAGDVVLLHGCCHNPTGVDPSPQQWREIARAVSGSGALPLVDFAYQGFAENLEADAAGLRGLVEACPELIVCSSFSKNFGLYNERVGALTAVARDATAAARVASQIKISVRRNYSNPPAHGAAIVETVLSTPELRARWEEELASMRERILAMRRLFVRSLKERGVERDFSFIERQRGMFSFSGLGPEQVTALREKFSIYIVDSGRINVAGMTEANMDALSDAIASVC